MSAGELEFKAGEVYTVNERYADKEAMGGWLGQRVLVMYGQSKHQSYIRVRVNAEALAQGGLYPAPLQDGSALFRPEELTPA